MNMKAFTLVELLAVIVVLAVILVIAIPRVMNAIEESRKESYRITGEQLINGAQDKAVSESISSAEDKIYTITDGAFVGDSFSINGELPDDGTIVVQQNGDTSIAALKGDYCIKKDLGEENVSISKDPDCGILVPTLESCFTRTNDGLVVTITDYDNSCSKDVIIPIILDSLPVTTIVDDAFYNNQLTSVIIPTMMGTASSEIWRIPAQGGTPLKLDLSVPKMISFTPHPDNRRFAFSVVEGSKSELWVLENFLPKEKLAEK